MNTPKYIIDIMSRAKYAKGYGEPGYTIEIHKARPQTLASTFEKEINRLVKYTEREWMKRLKANGWTPDEGFEPISYIQSVPSKTHYCDQYAVVTIFDPIMLDLEKWIQ